jgi:hypothetical protein
MSTDSNQNSIPSISNSLEWINCRNKLLAQIRTLEYNAELRKLLANIDGLVSDLSKREVEARRMGNPRVMQQPLESVNSAIATLHRWIIMGILLQ